MVARMIFLTVVVIALAIGGVLLLFKPLIVRYIGILKAKDAIDEQNEAERKHLETLRAQAEEELNNDLGIRPKQSQGMK